MFRNIAGQLVTAQLNALADGTPVTSGTTTVTVIKDGIDSAGTGTITHVSGGLWSYVPLQSETDAAHLTYIFSNILAASQSPQMYTEINVNTCTTNSDMRGTDSANTVAPDNAGINANGAAIAGLNDFNPATDNVANVSLVATCTTNTDMRGTDNALLDSGYVAPDNASISSILIDTNELQTNQGDWATATGFSVFNPVTDEVASVASVTTNLDMRGTDGANTIAPDNTTIGNIDTKVDNILVDTGTDIPALIAALNDLSAAEVKAELVAALTVDATVEPTSPPSSTAPISAQLSYLLAKAVNKEVQTTSQYTLRNRADSADIATAPVTSTGTETTKGVTT